MSGWRERVAQREAALAVVRAELIDLLKLERCPDELDPDMPLFDAGLGADSLDFLELAVRLEGHYRVTFSPAEAAIAMRTLNTLVDHVTAPPP